ncbi:D-alanyl-D-alanine carboxypeptidase family protein [Cellulomonas sp. DKR-3]|uniref:D-alanyl-D-alanine carboxypeptidase family protein n=1 Tax=Cellulomonas fulva TaxID=2835530 RepID=A0ABS5TVU7_9CELL|nr:D-alanyl-D-alanine carboxypeptidase family protein [Cellulomonas fulva]MBT0993237.1 D-alanyl-D-alanine carboxypeptidase family protein [Cellulomonas fulva]
MTDEPQRRRTSGGGRHAAPRRSRAPRPTTSPQHPARSVLGRALPTSTPGRVAQGVLVVALAGSLGGLAAQTSASADPRSGERLAARAAVADAAVDALTVAQAAQHTAQDVTVDGDQVAELEAATAELQHLLAQAGVADVSELGGDASAEQTADPASDPTTESTADPTTEPTAEPTTEPTADADAEPTDPEPTDPEPTDAASAAAEGLLSASGDRALTTGTSSDEPTSDATTSSDEPTSDPTTEPTTDASTEPSTDATTDPSAGPTADGAAPEDVVVPPVSGAEDATTTRLRAALQRVVELSDEVLDTAAQEVADREAAQAAAEAKEKAAQEAAEQAAKEKAEQEAAERAAWKESLLGYPNGQIPSSALCAASFDENVLLRCDATEDLEALDEAYAAEFGEHLTITDSYRSYAAQVSCRARKGSLCAVPGTSNHGTGTAIDLGGGAQGFGTPEWTWLSENAAEFGWEHPDWAEQTGSKPEPWHWEYTR